MALAAARGNLRQLSAILQDNRDGVTGGSGSLTGLCVNRDPILVPRSSSAGLHLSIFTATCMPLPALSC
jgi:hypothetical protein